jgi:hypothetical protein
MDLLMKEPTTALVLIRRCIALYPNFVHDTTITAMLAIVAMLLGFTYTPSNYKIGATFVTIYVVLFMPFNPNTADGSVPHFRYSLLELIYLCS